METSKLKKFAQFARRSLIEQVSGKLKLVLTDGSAARREKVEAVRRLEEIIKLQGKEQVIERVAYIWFNRFCALHFMDVNRYTRIGVVSPAEGQFQPEILAEAKMGHIDEEMVSEKTRQKIFALIGGKAPSRDPQGEAYRLLVVAACNFWHQAMPFLFERIDDYTELLMPDDLLSGNSILACTREAMTPDACQDVEVIGWLYQFYISEKKDEVFEGLKKNKKIKPENIPAATQLFTPHWIVRYLVENSLGRLWMLNRPNSRLIEQMDYYIKPEQPETDFLRIRKPEEIKICDPACGSGHMLVYAFDLLHAIYEEEGYEPAEIPEKILTHNLYGIEIDERAGELAAFALTMKARAKQRRFFRKQVVPNICVLENIHFEEGELKDYMDFVGWDRFTAPLQTTLHQFEEADNFGSLIRPEVKDVGAMIESLKEKNVSGDLFLNPTHHRVLRALRQADYLRSKYHVVIANPPYMGVKGMNGRLATWAKENFPNSKSDLFAVFVERIIYLASRGGAIGLMTPFTWMFLSSYETLRNFILENNTITALVRPEYHSFFESAYVPICGFTLFCQPLPEYRGAYIDLKDYYGVDLQPKKTLQAIRDHDCGWFYRASSSDFKKLPGAPIAYWISPNLKDVFQNGIILSEIATPRQGLATADNDKFLRCWHEISINRAGFMIATRDEAKRRKIRWIPYNKGGAYRKWYGNQLYMVNWENDGQELFEFRPRSVIRNPDTYFRESISWSKITSGGFSLRYFPPGFIYDVAGCSIFVNSQDEMKIILGSMNSKVMSGAINSLSPTLNFEVGHVAHFPIPKKLLSMNVIDLDFIDELIGISKSDWNSFETSWDFTNLLLLHPDYRQRTLKATYQKLRAHWQKITLDMQRLEVENNSLFIEAYGLQVELTSDVSLSDITLTCNPHYRYSGERSVDELEKLLLADTMQEFISYSVGCMFGRYAIEKPGLVLANQGDTFEDYLNQISEPSFPADDDNVIPMLDGDWFPDDITERFRKFLRVSIGEEHYEANLEFIEKALGKNGKARDIRDYFLKDFYYDHVKRYKKRPIYWLFSSPRGSFNALIYMHRYRPDTVSVVLNDYLREFRNKLSSRLDHLKRVEVSADATKSEKTKALKEIESLKKIIDELDTWDREVLYPLATEQIEIDLDDGVKVNYAKFGAALKKIPGLEAKENE